MCHIYLVSSQLVERILVILNPYMNSLWNTIHSKLEVNHNLYSNFYVAFRLYGEVNDKCYSFDDQIFWTALKSNWNENEFEINCAKSEENGRKIHKNKHVKMKTRTFNEPYHSKVMWYRLIRGLALQWDTKHKAKS